MYLKLFLSAATASLPVSTTAIYIEGAEQPNHDEASSKVALMSLPVPGEETVTIQANGDGPVATTLMLPANGEAFPPAEDNAITTTANGNAHGADPNVCNIGSNEVCRDDEFCMLPLSSSDESSISIHRSSAPNGVCTLKPQACNMMFDPVCGFDEQTHSNECVAWSKGSSAAYRGECVQDKNQNGTGAVANANFDSDVIGTEWTAAVYYNATSGVLSDVVQNSDITLAFEDNGHFSGHSGCNQYSGGYAIVSDSAVMINGEPSSTYMLCPDETINQQEQYYLQIFNGEIHWSVFEDGTKLELANTQGDVLARFVSNAAVPEPYTGLAEYEAAVSELDKDLEATKGDPELLGASSGAMLLGTATTALVAIAFVGFAYIHLEYSRHENPDPRICCIRMKLSAVTPFP